MKSWLFLFELKTINVKKINDRTTSESQNIYVNDTSSINKAEKTLKEKGIKNAIPNTFEREVLLFMDNVTEKIKNEKHIIIKNSI